MIPVLKKEWRGVLALIWLVGGGVLEIVVERLTRDSVAGDYLSSEWRFVGWWGPAFVLAISGVRHGNVASRVCGALGLVAFAVPIIFILYVGHILSNH